LVGRRHACGQAWRGGIRHAWCSAHPARPAGRPEEFTAATAMPWRTVWDVEMFRQRGKINNIWIDQKPRRKHIYPYICGPLLWPGIIIRYCHLELVGCMHACMGHMTCHVLA
jgi:hypothetical protein